VTFKRAANEKVGSDPGTKLESEKMPFQSRWPS